MPNHNSQNKLKLLERMQNQINQLDYDEEVLCLY